MSDKKLNDVYFISDCHLGARYISDPRAHESRIARWLLSLIGNASELYLLGDIIDYWFEYRYVVPRGYTRFFGALATLADAGVKITWVKGNHDIWLFDYLRDEIGITIEDGIFTRIIDGHRFVLGHGDSIDDAGIFYRIMRSMFRCRFLQWLYAGIHPRWTVGFAHGWSANNRKLHSSDSSFSAPDDPHGLPLPENDGYVRFIKSYMANNPMEGKDPTYFVFGHRHFVHTQNISPHATLVVLGDAFSRMTFGRFHDGVLSIERMP